MFDKRVKGDLHNLSWIFCISSLDKERSYKLWKGNVWYFSIKLHFWLLKPVRRDFITVPSQKNIFSERWLPQNDDGLWHPAVNCKSFSVIFHLVFFCSWRHSSKVVINGNVMYTKNFKMWKAFFCLLLYIIQSNADLNDRKIMLYVPFFSCIS